MSKQLNFYDGAYGNFADDVLSDIRRETYGTDLGQSSWTTVDEYDHFCDLLKINAESSVLETASGSGGLALHVAERFGCNVTGIDINNEGVDNANHLAIERGIPNAKFQLANVDDEFPFDDRAFSAVICIDAANHFPDRAHVLREWGRVLKPGGRLLFTDPVVITGAVTNHELSDRSSIGTFVFIPPDVTERFISDAGMKLLDRADVTENVAATSGRWHAAREKRREDLIKLEGEESFVGLQRFLLTVHRVTSERRLSRYAFLAEK